MSQVGIQVCDGCGARGAEKPASELARLAADWAVVEVHCDLRKNRHSTWDLCPSCLHGVLRALEQQDQ